MLYNGLRVSEVPKAILGRSPNQIHAVIRHRNLEIAFYIT